MFPISTKAGGQCMTIGPLDVCKTPTPTGPIPIPYPNIAMVSNADASSCTSKVKIDGKKVLTRKSKIPMSTGDEAGSVGGVISNTIKGEVKYLRGSVKVKAEGDPVVFLTSNTAHNGNNANAPVGLQVAPSQTKVFAKM